MEEHSASSPFLGSSRAVAGLLTCSFHGDLDLFRLLAESIDKYVTSTTPHVVLVPRDDLPLFRPFASGSRQILEEEDFLPKGMIRAPLPPASWRRRLGLSTRNLYLSRGVGLVRGWIVQQMIKLEAARRMPWDLVLHVDSDAAFIRRYDPAELVTDQLIRFYRLEGAGNTEMHAPWHQAAGRLLGLPPQDYFGADYIENLISWRPATVQMLADHISRTTQRSWMDAIAQERQLSEYVLYGVFCDHVLMNDGSHAPSPETLCLTVWPKDQTEVLRGGFVDLVRPHHVALGIQSTIPLSMDDRRAIIESCASAADRA